VNHPDIPGAALAELAGECGTHGNNSVGRPECLVKHKAVQGGNLRVNIHIGTDSGDHKRNTLPFF